MLVFALIACGALLAVLGAAFARVATPAARWLGLLVALAFAVAAGVADRTVEQAVAPRVGRAALEGDATARRTAMLRAAARSGPRVEELELSWRAAAKAASGEDPQPDEADAAPVPAPPAASLGAVARLPAAMPFSPEDVRLRAAARAEVDRPALLEVQVAGLDGPVSAEVVVSSPDGDVVREAVVVGAAPQSVAFTPIVAGAYEASLAVVLDGHRVVATGRFEVAPPNEVLVIDPSGVAAAALRAQGERVRASAELPDDWRRHRRLVLGRTLSVTQQKAVVEAVQDGAGLFVLPGAFGPEGAPLRAVLPVQPRPVERADGDEQGSGGGSADQEPAPPEDAPSEPPPPAEPPRIGSTAGAKPISEDPIEVDKHAIAMVLVIDRSASMGQMLADGMTKMSYAKTSALRTAQALGEGDRVGLVTFGNEGEARVELAMADATADAVIRAGIERLADQQEWTYLLSGLRSARAQLRSEQAAVKHVVVLTDGEFQSGQRVALNREAFRMRTEDKTTVSIISIVGTQTDPGFKAIAYGVAKEGGGAFIATEDPSKVPVLVSSEVTRALSRVGRSPNLPGPPGDDAPPPEEPAPPPESDEPEPEPQPEPPPPQPEAPVALPVVAVEESKLLEPAPAEWPSLGAAVRCDAPLDSRVLLVVGDEGWPLLAFCNRGLGRVGAFTGELHGNSGRAFREARSFPAWLSQWLAATDAADAALDAEDLRDSGEITPPAPVPTDVDYLRALGGGATQPPAPTAAAPAAVVGSEAVGQAARFAIYLLPLVLLLACAERWLASRALRRGGC